MIRRLLIANRGEIACRIARTCQRLGIEFVAVYSQADSEALHLEGAVATVCLGPGPATASYLSIPAVVQAALDTGCDAVHPGYGFLSENAAFARAVLDAGLVFVGPAPDTIDAMGDKSRAKAMMRAAGVPVVPGNSEATDDAGRIAALVAEVGFPALLKPAMGGGGKGMVVLESDDGLAAAVQGAVRQARASFGDGRLLVERFVRRPRHIEVQVFGDAHGNVVHLFERECSLQRRHQKIIEEAPAADLPDATRQALREAALAGTRAIGYRNAGTFEFIVAEGGRDFFFLEMNTRLQVEHPVTESVTGQDLVEWQLRVAAGEPLPLAQDELVCRGHAVECRVYAEDPANGFRPSPGRLQHVHWPPGVRVDAGVVSGSQVPSFYDPIIAKLITHAPDRAGALQKMDDALAHSCLLGLTTNLGFLRSLLLCPQVQAGTFDTGFVDALPTPEAPDSLAAAACTAAVRLAESVGHDTERSPWFDGRVAGYLNRRDLDNDGPAGRLYVGSGDDWHEVLIQAWTPQGITLSVGQQRYQVCLRSGGTFTVNGRQAVLWHGTLGANQRWFAQGSGHGLELLLEGTRMHLSTGRSADALDDASATVAVSPMPGVVAALLVAPGDTVEKNQVVAVVEAMKMENSITAPLSGTVAELACKVGDIVGAGAVLVSFTATDAHQGDNHD